MEAGFSICRFSEPGFGVHISWCSFSWSTAGVPLGDADLLFQFRFGIFEKCGYVVFRSSVVKVWKMKCYSCNVSKEAIKEEWALTPCDLCKQNFCSKCLGLVPTEIRVLQLKNRRVMKIFCVTCTQGMEIGIMKGVHELEKLEIKLSASEDLIHELRDKNRVLNDNIKLLEENKMLLEKSLKELESGNSLANLSKGKSGNVNAAIPGTVPVSYSGVAQSSGKTSASSNPVQQSRDNVVNIIKAQDEAMKRVINLVPGGGDNILWQDPKVTLPEKDGDGFQTKTRKKKPMVKRVPETKFAIGKNASKSGKVSGAVRRKWIYVGRIAGKEVAEADIQDYLSDLKGLEKYEHIVVKKLNTLGSNSAFCIGLPTDELYNRVFSVDYWSEGVSLREYDLRSSFLTQRSQKKNLLQSSQLTIDQNLA